MSIRDILFKFASGESALTTYRIGVLQNTAYRELKKVTNRQLKQFGIGSGEWAVLGTLYEHENGMSVSALAREVFVEIPYVTELIAQLVAKNLVLVDQDANDKRAKVVLLSERGRELVPGIEDSLREDMKYLMNGVSVLDVMAYVRTLVSIVRNSREKG